MSDQLQFDENLNPTEASSRYPAFRLRRDFAFEAGTDLVKPEWLTPRNLRQRLARWVQEELGAQFLLRRYREPRSNSLRGYGMLVPPGEKIPVPCVLEGGRVRRVRCPGLFADLERRVRVVTGACEGERLAMSAAVQPSAEDRWIKPRYLVLQFENAESAELVATATALRLLEEHQEE